MHSGVALLPTRAGSGEVWRWHGECPLAPAASKGCQAAGPILGFAQLNGDAWNLGGPAGAGSVDMSVEPGGAVTIEGRFDRTAPCTAPTCLAPSANTWVRGYPSVMYGLNQCFAETSPPTSPELPLPMRLDSLPPHLIGVTDYSAQTAHVTYTVTYDLWLNPTDTKQPCRTDGTLEILVLTDYSTRGLQPPGMPVGTADIPVAVGEGDRLRTQRWAIYASNIGRDGWTAPWGGTLWFVPDPADAVHEGRVSVDLSAVLAEAGRALLDTFGWTGFAQRYWLDTVAFGVEFGPWSGDPMDSGPSSFSARISAFCLDGRASLRDAACS